MQRDDGQQPRPACTFEQAETDLFVVLDGRRIAKRGKPDTPQARTWVTLEPGVTVLDNADLTAITVEINGVRVH
jgi:hypothetical protein